MSFLSLYGDISSLLWKTVCLCEEESFSLSHVPRFLQGLYLFLMIDTNTVRWLKIILHSLNFMQAGFYILNFISESIFCYLFQCSDCKC